MLGVQGRHLHTLHEMEVHICMDAHALRFCIELIRRQTNTFDLGSWFMKHVTSLLHIVLWLDCVCRMGKVLHIWNHARIAQLCWPLGIVPYVVSICWVYILWLASIWYFHTHVWILFESCWLYISWLASIGCFYTLYMNLWLNLAGCASCVLHHLDASMHLCVNLVSILLGVHIVACIDWMLLYTYVWTFWFCGRKMG
jgi:hypothetical protein